MVSTMPWDRKLSPAEREAEETRIAEPGQETRRETDKVQQHAQATSSRPTE